MNNKSVYTRIIGGLGNQMFQYAAGFALAKHYNCPLKLDLSLMDKYTVRELALPEFGINDPIATQKEIDFFRINSKWRRKAGKAFGKIDLFFPKATVIQPHFHFMENFFDLTPPVLLDGYWMSEKYFAPVREEVASIFQNLKNTPPLYLELADRISSAKFSASIHIRLGDYLTGKTFQKMTPLSSTNYYDNAIASIKSIAPETTFFLFSDQPEKIVDYFPDLENSFVMPEALESPVLNMHLMSLCHHNIIANSTFSWWAGWLNSHPNKRVVAPQQWFTEIYAQGRDTKDLYPQDWIQLD